MKLAGYDNGTEIHLAEHEMMTLGGNRCSVTFNSEDSKKWIVITADSQGVTTFNKRNELVKYPTDYPYRTTISKSVRHFGRFQMQPVATSSPGRGILWGSKPDLSLEAGRRKVGPYSRPKKVVDANMEHVREAVQLINNFMASNPGVEVTVEEGRLRIRLIVEF